jgi:hypothetical protein
MLDNRERPHIEPHIRSLERQALDCLLRIEELLIYQNRPSATVGQQAPAPATKAAEPKPKSKWKG